MRIGPSSSRAVLSVIDRKVSAVLIEGVGVSTRDLILGRRCTQH